MEHGHHGMLISNFNILEMKRHGLLTKITPWSSEGYCMLINLIDQNLIVFKNPINEG